MNVSGVLNGVEGKWAHLTSDSPGVRSFVLAQLRLVRPTTRLWLDTLMPLTVLSVANGGPPPAFVAVMFVLTMNLVHLSATIFNDIHDVDVDKYSTEAVRRFRPIARGIISVPVARFEAIVAAAGGVVVSYVLSWVFGLIITALAAITLMHEIPPFRVQGRTVVAQLYTTAGIGLLMGSILYIVPEVQWATALPYAAFVCLYLGLCETLVKDIRDVDNDSDGGKMTTAVKYGADKAAFAGFVAYSLVGLVWLFYLLNADLTLMSLPAAATLLFVGWIIYVGYVATQLRVRFSKNMCISLHKGSALVFSALNACALIAVAW